MDSEIISSNHVIHILNKALNLIDQRLVDHGERVAYIVYKMLKLEGIYSNSQIKDCILLALFHDIGAYKTEEIDNMVRFETEEVLDHSIYGYLFLNYFSPLKSMAETILLHHLDYNRLKPLNHPCEYIASYINLADRIDVYLAMSQKPFDISDFNVYKDIKFSSKSIELFLLAEGKYKILQSLKDSLYKEEMYREYEKFHFTYEEKEMFLKMLSYTIDFRSEYTLIHTITTVSIANQLSILMNLPHLDRRKLHFGAWVHDIGKIATPIEILEAPRGLTDTEMDVMKNHVVMTERILKDYVDKDVLEIAIRHHEKLDGSGYHKRWSGEELTLSQRILSVADIMSALVGERSYKPAYTKERVIDLLLRDADCGKICSNIVGCVIKNYDKIIEQVYKDCATPLSIRHNMQKEYRNLYEQFMI